MRLKCERVKEPGRTQFTIIMAHDLIGNIGKAGHIPWHMPADLSHYASMTRGKPVIVGRKTYESLPEVALSSRVYIVITRDTGYALRRSADYRVSSVQEAIETADRMTDVEVMVAGGREIYRQFLGLADRAIVTTVRKVTEGDTTIPVDAFDGWKVEACHTLNCDESGLRGRVTYYTKPNGEILTPCEGTCSCTQGDSICRGCKRTDEEVRDWNRYCPALKRLKMEVLCQD